MLKIKGYRTIWGGAKLYAVLISIAVITGLLMLITFEYVDVNSLTAWSLNFWDLLFNGRLDEFYRYTSSNVHGASHPNCGGNFLLLLPLCVWNFPLWVVHSVGGIVSVRNIYSICWTKSFWFLLQIVTAYVSRKICTMMTSDRNKIIITMLLIVASPEILMSAEYAGQDEIDYVCLFVIALYCFLKGYWKRCYLLMVCSVSLCPIMILPSLALLLLKEKKAYRLISYALGMILPLLLFELLYRNDAVYQSVKHINDFGPLMLKMLSELELYIRGGTVSVVGIVLCGVFFLCYVDTLPQNQSEKYNQKVIYIVTLIFMIIAFLMLDDYDDFYRMFIYVPFLVVLIMTSKQDIGYNLFLFTMITYGRMFQLCRSHFTMNTLSVIKNSWITSLCDRTGSARYLEDVYLWKYISDLGEILGEELLELVVVLVATCVLGAALILIVINGVEHKKKYEPMFCKNVMLVIYTLCMPAVMICYYIMLF